MCIVVSHAIEVCLVCCCVSRVSIVVSCMLLSYIRTAVRFFILREMNVCVAALPAVLMLWQCDCVVYIFFVHQ